MRVHGQSAELQPDAWADLVMHGFEDRLRATARDFESRRVAAPSAVEVVELVTAALPKAAPHALDAEVGPFYDTVSVMTLLGGVTKQAVDARRRKGSILALRTSDDRWVYPVFQFTEREVDQALLPAFRVLKDAPAWSAAMWFTTQNADLDDLTPLEWARRGRSAGPLVLSARHAANEWQR